MNPYTTPTPRKYFNQDGYPITLLKLIKTEPEWAENQIRHRDKLEAENQKIHELLEKALNYREDGPVGKLIKQLEAENQKLRELCGKSLKHAEILTLDIDPSHNPKGHAFYKKEIKTIREELNQLTK